MIAVTRYQVADAEVGEFLAQARVAVALLSTRSGFVSADLAQNLDEPTLWTIVTRWQNVGSYRRALSGNEARMVVVPLLSRALDEPSAYEDPTLIGERPRARGDDPPDPPQQRSARET